jgi:putative ABC transport system permease protein
VPQALDVPETVSRRNATILYAVGRLKPGATLAQARASLGPLFANSMKDVPPNFRKDVSLRLRPLRDLQIHDSRLASWILLAAVLAVLLIACANVANLLLARAAGRRRELAVRAHWARRACAWYGRRSPKACCWPRPEARADARWPSCCCAASSRLRRRDSAPPSGGYRYAVLLFTWRYRSSPVCCSASRRRSRIHAPKSWPAGVRWAVAVIFFRQALVAAQIAISVVLLAGAGLLLRSLWNLENQPLGMRVDGVMTATVTLGQQSYADPARRLAFFEDWEARLRQTPGVTGVALVNALPPSQCHPVDALQRHRSRRAGRRIPTAPAEMWRGAISRRIISRSSASPCCADGRLRRRSRTRSKFRHPERRSGAPHVPRRRSHRQADPARPPRTVAYRDRRGRQREEQRTGGRCRAGILRDSQARSGDIGRTATAVVRTSADPRGMARWLRAEVAAIDPTTPVAIESMQQHVGQLAERRDSTRFCWACSRAWDCSWRLSGCTEWCRFLVAQRTQEIGVRMALGATPAAHQRTGAPSRRAIHRRGGSAGRRGLVLRAPLAGRHAVPRAGPRSMDVAGVLAMLVAVSMLAAWVPSRRAARVNPVEALRQE